MTDARPLLFIISRFSVGGAERLVIDELHELHRRGVEAHIVTLHPEGRSSLLQELHLPSGYIHTLPVSSLFSVYGVIKLSYFIQKLRPRAVICHLWYANTVGRLAARLAGISQVIIFEHNIYDDVKSPIQFFIDQLLQGLTVRIVAVSGEIQESLIRHGIRTEYITLLHNGIDITRYQEITPVDLRRTYMLPRDSYLLLAVGRLTFQKGFDILIHALTELPLHTHLIIVGMGEEERELKILATQLGVERRVHFTGIRQDVPALLKGSDCFVMPSRWEGEPIVLLEALAVGIPVVGSNIPALQQVIREGINGLLVPKEDAKALGEALRKIIENKATLRPKDVYVLNERTIVHHTDLLLSLLS